jgi:hypothetical protein
VPLPAQSVGERRAAQVGGARWQTRAGTGLGSMGRQKPMVALKKSPHLRGEMLEVLLKQLK